MYPNLPSKQKNMAVDIKCENMSNIKSGGSSLLIIDKRGEIVSAAPLCVTCNMCALVRVR